MLEYWCLNNNYHICRIALDFITIRRKIQYLPHEAHDNRKRKKEQSIVGDKSRCDGMWNEHNMAFS